MKKYYYLINGKLYWANSEMPLFGDFTPNTKGEIRDYERRIGDWKDSLQPCEITDGELLRIKDNIKDYWHTYNDPINVNDLVEEDWNGHCIIFKHPKQVDEASLIDLELIIRRENGNDLKVAQRIVNEYSKLKQVDDIVNWIDDNFPIVKHDDVYNLTITKTAHSIKDKIIELIKTKQVDEASEAVELIKYLDECIEACDANCSVFKGKEMKTSYLCSNAMKTAYSNVKTFIETTEKFKSK